MGITNAEVERMRARRRARQQEAHAAVWRMGHFSGMYAGLDILRRRFDEGRGFEAALKSARADIEMLYPVLVGELEAVDG